MIGDTLTRENLTAIKLAMLKIKEVDQSDFFKNYLMEVNGRMDEFEKSSSYSYDECLAKRKELYEK